MMIEKTDVCVIGAGSGGLSIAVAASQMGAKTTLIEAHRMGGDCLNFGCVPSKSLLAAAKMAHMPTISHDFGVTLTAKVDYQKIHNHVKSVIAKVEPNDSVERMESLGITVLRGHAGFTSTNEVLIDDDRRVQAKWFVIATGSSPAIPAIPGIESTPYFTNETIFENTKLLEHLIVIGGGPIGIELAQAHAYLGAKVTVLEIFSILPRDDQELVSLLRPKLIEDGLEIYEHITIQEVSNQNGQILVKITQNGKSITIKGSHLLIAAGRKPNVQKLHLERARIDYTQKGIQVDRHLKTTNSKIFAIGDVIGQHQFTHMAHYHAGIVIANMLLRIPKQLQKSAIPWVIFTDPELAHVGLIAKGAMEKHTNARVLTWSYCENDRAHAEHQTFGVIKVTTTKRGKILGASILGAHAGELITPWTIAIQQGLNIKDISETIVPYPTLSEISKRAAGSFFTPILFGEQMHKIVQFLLRFVR